MFRFEVDKPTRIKMVYSDYKAPRPMPQYPSVDYYNQEKKGVIKDDKGTVLLQKGIYYAQVSSHYYSWERKQMVGKFKVQFKTNVQAGDIPETARRLESTSRASQNSQPTTDKPKVSRRKAKRGLWIFEVEKVQ